MKQLLAGRSIRFRLTAWYAGILAVTFLLAGAYVAIAVQDAAEDTLDKDLQARLAPVREQLTGHKGERDSEGLANELDEQASEQADVWLQIADAQGRWVYRSPAAREGNATPLSAKGLGLGGRTYTASAKGKSLRMLTAPVNDYVVQIGTPMDEFTEMFEDLRWTLGLTTPVLLLLASAGGYWMSGRALRPVDRIERTLRGIGARNLSERLATRGAGDELDRLSGTMNQMLGRLEGAFQLVTQFTADASHELRTPVAIIRTTGEVIRGRERTAQEHEAAWDQVIVQTERMSGLIDDLLLLARADAGKSSLTFEAVDLAELLRGVTREIRILADRSGLQVTESIPPGCAMEGDAPALRRVFLVLLDNAIKFTPAGGEISVRLREILWQGRTAAEVEVCDTGVGIPAEDLPRIFDRFYRTSADRSRKTGGSGLGLSIAQSLTVFHGGEISAESKMGAGSKFRVVLPLKNRAETQRSSRIGPDN